MRTCDDWCAAAVQGLAAKKTATKEEKEDLVTARKVQTLLEDATDIRHASWNLKETDFLNQQQFISAKPVVYLVNMSSKDFIRKKNKHLPKVMEYVKENGGDTVIPYSAAFEQEIFDMPPEDQEKVRSKSTAAASALTLDVVAGDDAVRVHDLGHTRPRALQHCILALHLCPASA